MLHQYKCKSKRHLNYDKRNWKENRQELEKAERKARLYARIRCDKASARRVRRNAKFRCKNRSGAKARLSRRNNCVEKYFQLFLRRYFRLVATIKMKFENCGRIIKLIKIHKNILTFLFHYDIIHILLIDNLSLLKHYKMAKFQTRF